MKKLVLSSILLLGVCLTSNAGNLADTNFTVSEEDTCIRIVEYNKDGAVKSSISIGCD